MCFVLFENEGDSTLKNMEPFKTVKKVFTSFTISSFAQTISVSPVIHIDQKWSYEKELEVITQVPAVGCTLKSEYITDWSN